MESEAVIKPSEEKSGSAMNRGIMDFNLLLRVISAAVLAPLAVGAAWLGGWPFALFWTIAAGAVWWEWVHLVDSAVRRGMLVAGLSAVILEGGFAAIGHPEMAVLLALLGALAVAVVAVRNVLWTCTGFVYASLMLIVPVFIREEVAQGFAVMLFLFAVVWATDILGYFAGRAIGGPKLAVAISPKKTWAGAVGGSIGAILAGAAVSVYASGAPLRGAALAFLLSIAAQAGDLFESAVKRHFHAKDASTLIPGHGGVMDRLDGFIAAALALVLIVLVQFGLSVSDRGLALW
jgi:phosphatidate cytidylyltransferase